MGRAVRQRSGGAAVPNACLIPRANPRAAPSDGGRAEDRHYKGSWNESDIFPKRLAGRGREPLGHEVAVMIDEGAAAVEFDGAIAVVHL
jgi:hypothetical protein